MKKFLLSAIVILAFISYSAYLRIRGVSETPVVLPKTIGSHISSPTPTNVPPSPTSTPSPVPTTTSTQDTPTSTPQPVIPTATPIPASGYKDGSYTGSAADAFYGNIQIQATISSGRITNIQFLQYPNDRGTSIAINQQADPMLAQEAIQAQNAQVDIVSGATDSSQAFIQSLQSALDKAKS